VDTLRADYLAPYGGAVETPFADALAAEGIVFERTVSHVPITLPSHASIFTGRYPLAHGVRDNGSYRLAESETTLAEAFTSAGYRSAAFVGSFALDSRFGLDQGFELYDDFYGDTSPFDDFAISERSADDVLAPALAWIREAQATRWFVFLHLYDPHAPYVAPPAFRERHPGDAYGGEVAYVDDALGRFVKELRELGVMDNTLVILTSDHGESLGEHGEKTHGMFAYESTMHVPLIMSWNGVLPEGVRVQARVRLVDVAPTLMELVGLPSPPGQQGESLVAAILQPDSARDRDSYFEALAFHLNRNWAPLTGLYRERFKFIDLPLPELYDLVSDPDEVDNVYRTRAATSRELHDELDEMVARESAATSADTRAVEVDEETRERLRALGYLVATGPGLTPAEFTEDDDPKRLVPLSDRFDRAVAANMAGRTDEAIRLFRAIIDERPSFTNAYANLAYVLHEIGRLDESIAVIELAMTRGAHNRSMLGRLGAYLQEAGRLEESVVLLESVVEDDPTYVEAFNYLGVSYSRLGRTREAIETLNRVLELDPSYASGYSNLGSVFLAGKRFGDAEALFGKALELDPRLATAWNGLGIVQASTGRESDAIESWKKAVSLDPRQYDTLYNLGTLLTKLNLFDGAIRYLDQFVETAPREQYRDDIVKVKNLVTQLKARRG
jgi:arylsulfatase A-like enzyme/Flp pilus assembly protein TadD